MSSSLDEKRIIAALQEAIPHRIQSAALAHTENLTVFELEFGGKKFTAPDSGTDFKEWLDRDYPKRVNLAFKLPLRANHVLVDIDVDVRPLDGKWTQAREIAAGRLARIVLTTMEELCGIDLRLAFGRKSQGGWGHAVLTVATPNGTDDHAIIRAFSGRGPIWVPVGDMKIGLEVRMANKMTRGSKDMRSFTAPGSVYAGHWDKDTADSIIWQNLRTKPDARFDAPDTITILELSRALWSGLLVAIMDGYWIDGQRHEIALPVAGVIAAEIESEIEGERLFDDAHGERLIRHICQTYGDVLAVQDRLKVLSDTLAKKRANGGPVTGYTRFGEDISREAKNALLRLRGDNNPDIEAALLERLTYARKTCDTVGDAYLHWPSLGRICQKSEELRRDYAHHPSFPDRRLGKGKTIAMIEWILRGNKHLSQVDEAVRLPGIAPRTYFRQGLNRELRLATPEEMAVPGGEGLIVNIAAGFATECPETPDARALAQWAELWDRHLDPLTQGKPKAKDRIDQFLAWAIRRPLDKIASALVLSAGQGLGKTSLFDSILSCLLGPSAIAKTTMKELEGDFLFQDIEGSKFMVFEEVRLSAIPVDAAEMIKDFIKNTTITVNKKYGAKRRVDNHSLGVVLTNEENPGYLIKGEPDRATAYIFGHTQTTLGMSGEEFAQYRRKVGMQIEQFIGELKARPELREAAMFYFMRHIEEPSRAELEDNTGFTLDQEIDIRSELHPLDQAICNIVEQDCIHSRYQPGNPRPLTFPFTMELLRHGVAEQLGKPYAKVPDARVIAKRLNQLLRKDDEDVLIRHKFTPPGEAHRKRVHLFTIAYGDIVARIEHKLGVKLDPARDIDETDYGPNPKPSLDDCMEAYTFRVNSLGPMPY